MADVDGKRQRQRKPKVRTGCRTCKLRRIKCDEERPSCRRCYTTSRICGGYEVSAPRTESNRALAILPRPKNEIPAKVSQASNLWSIEAYNFDYFRSNTLQILPGITRLIQWEQLIYQVSQKEPAVMSAAVAVGSIHRSFESKRWPSAIPDDPELQKTISRQRYVRAMRLLRDRLSSSEDPEKREVALISCFLFICLELIQSDIMAAINHLRSGLGILRERSKKSLGAHTSLIKNTKIMNSAMDYFSDVFGRLDYQSTLFGETTPRLLVIPATNNTKSTLWIPFSFTDLQEARQYLDLLISSVFAFRSYVVHDLAHGGNTPSDKAKRLHGRWAHMPFRQPRFESDDWLPQKQYDLEAGLAEWMETFDDFTKKNMQLFSPEDHRDVKVARMHYLAMLTLLKECLSTRQMLFDEYIEEFREMVELGEALNSEGGLLPTFSVDMVTHAPLYYVAAKCRDGAIRHKAVEILFRSRRREGMWDGHMIGQFMQRLVAIEEAHATVTTPAGQFVTCDQMPESARFHDITLGFSEDGTHGRIYVGRFKHESEGQWIVQETEFAIDPVYWEHTRAMVGKASDVRLDVPTPIPAPEMKLTATFDALQDLHSGNSAPPSVVMPLKSRSISGFPGPSAAELEAVRRNYIVQRAQAARDRWRSPFYAEEIENSPSDSNSTQGTGRKKTSEYQEICRTTDPHTREWLLP